MRLKQVPYVGGSASWCLEVLTAYASRTQPEALLSFIVVARPSRALADEPAKQRAIEIFGSALARCCRVYALLDLYKAAPLDTCMRSEAFVDTVLTSLSRRGYIEEADAVISDVSRSGAAASTTGIDFPPYAIIIANAGLFTGADGALGSRTHTKSLLTEPRCCPATRLRREDRHSLLNQPLLTHAWWLQV